LIELKASHVLERGNQLHLPERPDFRKI